MRRQVGFLMGYRDQNSFEWTWLPCPEGFERVVAKDFPNVEAVLKEFRQHFTITKGRFYRRVDNA